MCLHGGREDLGNLCTNKAAGKGLTTGYCTPDTGMDAGIIGGVAGVCWCVGAILVHLFVTSPRNHEEDLKC
jgi:hypothetical protein